MSQHSSDLDLTPFTHGEHLCDSLRHAIVHEDSTILSKIVYIFLQVREAKVQPTIEETTFIADGEVVTYTDDGFLVDTDHSMLRDSYQADVFRALNFVSYA